MRRHHTITTVLAAVAIIMATACSQRKQFTIAGTIDGAADSLLCLYNMSLSGPVPVDSVRLDAEGHFTFSGDAPEAPDFYALLIGNQLVNIAIDSCETVTVRAHYPGMAANYTVEGSDDCAKIRELALMHQQLQARVFDVEDNSSLTPGVVADSLQRLIDDYKALVRTNYIYQSPDRAYAYFALLPVLYHRPWTGLAAHTVFERSAPDDVRAFAAVATCWDTYYPEAQRTRHLHNTALQGMNERRATAARELQTLDPSQIVETGIIDLRLEDNHGRQRALSDLRGQVVLLDFHLFASPESGPRILKMRELYSRYHDRGLEIYQVSPDDDLHFWLQATETLPWVSVRDASGQSLQRYNVQTLPELFLIDRNSQLQKRSTQMDDLDAEIQALL